MVTTDDSILTSEEVTILGTTETTTIQLTIPDDDTFSQDRVVGFAVQEAVLLNNLTLRLLEASGSGDIIW